jgi:hypothetical protein
MTFIKEIEKSTIKFIWKHKRPRIAKSILSKKNNAGGITTRLQTILQSNSNKNSMALAQNRHEDQWNRIEDPKHRETKAGTLKQLRPIGEGNQELKKRLVPEELI